MDGAVELGSRYKIQPLCPWSQISSLSSGASWAWPSPARLWIASTYMREPTVLKLKINRSSKKPFS